VTVAVGISAVLVADGVLVGVGGSGVAVPAEQSHLTQTSSPGPNTMTSPDCACDAQPDRATITTNKTTTPNLSFTTHLPSLSKPGFFRKTWFLS